MILNGAVVAVPSDVVVFAKNVTFVTGLLPFVTPALIFMFQHSAANTLRELGFVMASEGGAATVMFTMLDVVESPPPVATALIA